MRTSALHASPNNGAYACTRVFRRDLTDYERNQHGITDDAPTCPQFAGAD